MPPPRRRGAPPPCASAAAFMPPLCTYEKSTEHTLFFCFFTTRSAADFHTPRQYRITRSPHAHQPSPTSYHARRFPPVEARRSPPPFRRRHRNECNGHWGTDVISHQWHWPDRGMEGIQQITDGSLRPFRHHRRHRRLPPHDSLMFQQGRPYNTAFYRP